MTARTLKKLDSQPTFKESMKRFSVWRLAMIMTIGAVAFTGCGVSVQNSSTGSAPGTVVERDSVPAELRNAMKAVEPFFQPMPAPGPNDWLATFNEPGQTFDEYINSN